MKPNTIKTTERIFEATNFEGNEPYLCNIEHFSIGNKGQLLGYNKEPLARVRHYWNNSLLKIAKSDVKDIILSQTNLGANIRNKTVWVGGLEINDYYLTTNEAEQLANTYKSEGYDNVQIETINLLKI